MTKPPCIYCGKFLPLVVSGMCAQCDSELKRYHARTADFCLNAPCLTPNSCAVAHRCKGIDD